MPVKPSSRPVLRRYLAAAVLVRLADEGARVALVLLAVQRTGSAGLGGMLIAALLVPHVAAAPGAGLLADRARQPRRVLAGAAAGFASALAATAAGLGRLPLPASLAVLLAGGACGPALLGGLTSQLASLVPAGALPHAFGLDSLTYNVSGIAGPSLAGVLSGAATPGVATAALAGSAGAGALVLATLPIRPARRQAAAPRLRDGALVMLRDRVLGTVTAASAVGQIGAGALPVIAAVLTGRLGVPSATGWLMTTIAAGGLLGSLAWTWRPQPASRAPAVVMAASLGMGVPLAVAAASPSLDVAAAMFAVSGFCLGPLTGALFTTRQARAPESLKAQVFSLGGGLKTSAAATGAALAGTLVGAPTGIQLLLAAACPVLAGACGALALAR